MKKHLQYLWYVIRHKWFVFVECCKLGIPWLGIVHDLSKFLPSEWKPYVDWFYSERTKFTMPSLHKRGDIVNISGRGDMVVVSQREYSTVTELLPAWMGETFDIAWLHHQKRNKHHWQYWMLVQDWDDDKVLPMPDRYRREMLADWRGAGRAINGQDETHLWYAKRIGRMKKVLHPDTRKWIEEQLFSE